MNAPAVPVSNQKISPMNVAAGERAEVDRTMPGPLSTPIRAGTPIDQEILESSILIVDDHRIMRQMIGRILTKSGFSNLHFAEDGVEALDVLDGAQPELIILDLYMPNMDGYEACGRLRRDPLWHDLPVLFQTGAESDKERAKVFEVGATDLVSKPINPPELVARVRLHLENRMLIRRLSQYRVRMDAELHAAQSMQEALLPSPRAVMDVATRQGLRIGSHYAACSELGGDIWSIRNLDDHRLAFYLTDFSGHGVGAALNTFRLHTFMERQELDLGDPGVCLTELNGFLSRVLPTGQFATMIYGVIDTSRDVLTYAAAASPRPILGHEAAGASIEMIPSDGFLVGAVKDARYETRQAPFGPDSFLLLYSDALIETPTAASPLLDEAALIEHVRTCVSTKGSDALIDSLTSHLDQSSELPLSDDLTMVSIARAATSAGTKSVAKE